MRAPLAYARVALVIVAAAGPAFHRASAAEPGFIRGGLEMAGRQVRCDNIRTRLDRRLPNLGAAAPHERLLILNPALLKRYSDTVQLFVFHHECGHHRVGNSELGADCWAVGQGVRDGWLDGRGIAEVCSSFANAPETPTHPSGKRRCANLDRCFAAATGIQTRVRDGVPRAVAAKAPAPEPRLIAEPQLLWSSYRR